MFARQPSRLRSRVFFAVMFAASMARVTGCGGAMVGDFEVPNLDGGGSHVERD